MRTVQVVIPDNELGIHKSVSGDLRDEGCLATLPSLVSELTMSEARV